MSETVTILYCGKSVPAPKEAAKTHLIVQDTPKTKSSNREIAISDGLCELLIRHLFTLANSSRSNPENLLFPSKAGTHLAPKSFEIRLNAVSKRCAIKKVNPHALRHSCAAIMLYLGYTLKDIQTWLGHSNYNFTVDTYIHSGIGVHEQMAESLSEKLGDVLPQNLLPGVNSGEVLENR